MVHDILILAASSGAGSSFIDFIGYVAIPLFVALVAGGWALIKGGLRFVQFMASSEASQRSIADSNVEIRDKIDETNTKLSDFAEKTNTRLNAHDQSIAVLNYVMGRNGDLTHRARAQEDQLAADTAERISQELKLRGKDDEE